MEGDVRVRDATNNDAHSVQRVARESWHAAYDSILGTETVEETVRSWFDPERLVADDICPPERPFFVAEIDEQVVGFIEAVPDNADDQMFHLYRIYIDPEYWGNGIGSTLLKRIETTLKEQDVTRLQLSVAAENDGAVHFYQSQGFDRVDEWYDDQLDVQRYVYTKGL